MKTKSKKRLLIIGGSVLVLGVVGVWFLVMAAPGTYDKAKALGMAVEPDDVYTTPAPDPADNAAPLLAQAREEMGRLAIDMDLIDNNLSMNTPAARAAAQAEIDRAAPVFALLEQAAKRPECRFDIDWAAYTFDSSGFFIYVRNVCLLLILRAEFLAQEGRFEEAKADLERTLVLARHLGSAPLKLSLMTQANLESRVFDSFGAMAEKMTTAEELSGLRDLADNELQDIKLFDSMRTEVTLPAVAARNMTLRQVAELSQKPLFSMPTPHELQRTGKPTAMGMALQLDRYLELWIPLYQLEEEERDNETVAEMLRQMRKRMDGSRDPRDAFAKMMIGGITLGLDSLKYREAAQAIALARIDLLIHRLTTGSFPASLDELDGEHLDPYTGKPLGYSKTADGFRVWSVSQNGVDDGGSKGDYTRVYP